MLRVEKEITVKAPMETCYKVGIGFEHYHQFLNGIQKIQSKGSPNVWHWQVNGPAGQMLEWDIEVVGQKHQNHVISWRTIRHGDIAHSGAMTFKPINPNQSNVHLVIEYTPSSEAYLSWKNELEKYGDSVMEGFLGAFKKFAENYQRTTA